MSSCYICGGQHISSQCDELSTELKELRAPKPTGPRGQDEEDKLCVSFQDPSAEAFFCHQSLQAADITTQRSGVIDVTASASSGDVTRK